MLGVNTSMRTAEAKHAQSLSRRVMTERLVGHGDPDRSQCGSNRRQRLVPDEETFTSTSFVARGMPYCP